MTPRKEIGGTPSKDEILWDSTIWLQARHRPLVVPSGWPTGSREDIVIADLSTENVVLREHVAALESDVRVYRTMLQEALTEVTRLTQLLERQRETMRRLLDLERMSRP